MTERLARIISDCGIASYSKSYWLQLDSHMWEELLEAAKGYPMGHYLVHFRKSTHHLPTLCDFRKIARGRYGSIHEWFRGPHAGSYLGAVPRDILGIVEFYLRARIEHDRTIRTSILGTPQSFADAPSQIIESDDFRSYSWTHAGLRHRDAEPAFIIIRDDTFTLECSWYHCGESAAVLGFITTMYMDEELTCVATKGIEWMVPIDETNTAVVALRQRLWETYRDFRA